MPHRTLNTFLDAGLQQPQALYQQILGGVLIPVVVGPALRAGPLTNREVFDLLVLIPAAAA